MENTFGNFKRDIILHVVIHSKDDLKEIFDVVSFEVSTFPYPHYDFTLFSGDYYRVPLSDIRFFGIYPEYDSIPKFDISDPLYRYVKIEPQLNGFVSEEAF